MSTSGMPHVYGKDKRERKTIKLELKVFLRFEQIEMGGTEHSNGTKPGFGVANLLNFPG